MEDWQAELERGRLDAAWDAFLGAYRRLLFAAIQRYAQDYDDVMDVFVRVCDALREDGMRRLRAYTEQSGARFTTWLVTVVHRLTIDWFRHRGGRRRLDELARHLPPLRRRIFELVFLERCSHVSAYEQIRTRDLPELPFREFLVELRATYSAVTDGRRGGVVRLLGAVPLPDGDQIATQPEPGSERSEQLERALATLSAEERVLISLHVEHELPAADIARIFGLPNAKAVYNRVYRVLAVLRSTLERSGIGPGDL